MIADTSDELLAETGLLKVAKCVVRSGANLLTDQTVFHLEVCLVCKMATRDVFACVKLCLKHCVDLSFNLLCAFRVFSAVNTKGQRAGADPVEQHGL